jgi:protein-S-isoprenylcysteine O-methyltransferase Ste14
VTTIAVICDWDFETPTSTLGEVRPATSPLALGTKRLLLPPFLDGIECALLLALYVAFVARLIGDWTPGSIVNVLLVPSEGLVISFMLVRRRSKEVSRHLGEWLLALGSLCCPLFVMPVTNQALVSPLLAAPVLLAGMLVQVYAKLALGRSFGVVPAHRGLKLAGPYRFVRHPMYAGYLLSHLAFLAMNPGWWNLAVYSLLYSLQIPRLLAEERLLERDAQYRAYSFNVRYRLIPGVF